MNRKKETRYYLVSEDLLPEAIRAAARVKDLLSSGKAAGLTEAIAAAGISKSTYYKYKDGVFTFYDLGSGETVNLSLMLRNEAGVLSGVLGAVASSGGNVLTINQGLPAEGEAAVTISIGMGGAKLAVSQLVELLSGLQGVSAYRVDGIQRKNAEGFGKSI